MEITLTAIETITPYARNARKIPQQAIDKVAASIQEFGWRQPVVSRWSRGHCLRAHSAGSRRRSSGWRRFRFIPPAI